MAEHVQSLLQGYLASAEINGKSAEKIFSDFMSYMMRDHGIGRDDVDHLMVDLMTIIRTNK